MLPFVDGEPGAEGGVGGGVVVVGFVDWNGGSVAF